MVKMVLIRPIYYFHSTECWCDVRYWNSKSFQALLKEIKYEIQFMSVLWLNEGMRDLIVKIGIYEIT